MFADTNEVRMALTRLSLRDTEKDAEKLKLFIPAAVSSKSVSRTISKQPAG